MTMLVYYNIYNISQTYFSLLLMNWVDIITLEAFLEWHLICLQFVSKYNKLIKCPNDIVAVNIWNSISSSKYLNTNIMSHSPELPWQWGCFSKNHSISKSEKYV